MAPSFVATQVVVAASGAVAARYGGAPERAGGAVFIAWALTHTSYHLLFGYTGFDTVDLVHVALDGAELAGMLWIALRANRVWPLWAAAAQLICVSGHVVALIEPAYIQRAYWVMTRLPQYIQLAALLLGAAAHARRERAIGPYRSWRVA